MRSLFKFFLVAVFVVFSTSAQAGFSSVASGAFDTIFGGLDTLLNSAAANSVGQFFTDSGSQIHSYIASTINQTNTFVNSGTTADRLTTGNGTPALSLFAVLSGILIIYAAIGIIQGSSPGDEIVEALLPIAFFGMLLTGYKTLFVVKLPLFFNDFISIVVSAGGASSSTGDAVATIVDTIFSAIGNILVSTISNGVGHFLVFLIAIFFVLGAIKQLIAAILKYVSLFLIADAIAGIALSIGPIFIAFGVLRATRNFFQTWLAALVSTFGVKVVAAATLPIIKEFASHISTTGNSAITDLILLMLFAEVLSMLIDMIPGIAQSIFGHMSGMGGRTPSMGASSTFGRDGTAKAAGMVAEKALPAAEAAAVVL